MSGIYLAASLTTIAALGIYGTIIRRMKKPVNMRLLLLTFFLMLPMQPLAFYLVRLPLNNWLVEFFGEESNFYQFLTTFYAPLTEEPAKLLPLLHCQESYDSLG